MLLSYDMVNKLVLQSDGLCYKGFVLYLSSAQANIMKQSGHGMSPTTRLNDSIDNNVFAERFRIMLLAVVWPFGGASVKLHENK